MRNPRTPVVERTLTRVDVAVTLAFVITLRRMAPVNTSQELGLVRIMMDGVVVAQEPLRALRDVPEGGFISRTLDEIQLWFE